MSLLLNVKHAKRRIRRLTDITGLNTFITKLAAFTLYWVATFVQSVSSKKYQIY